MPISGNHVVSFAACDTRSSVLAADVKATTDRERTAKPRKIWIDLENSPHVPFFKPIIDKLESRGYEVVLTARDCFQVCGLADLHKLRYRQVGRRYGKHTLGKLIGLSIRVLQLLPFVIRERPDVAVSHGSRSLFVLASLLRIPTITLFDYEHVRWTRFFSTSWAMVPEIIPDHALRIDRNRILRYPGIKEDVYAAFFQPNDALKQRLGLDARHLVVTVRPPATEAHYHNPESEALLSAVFEMISKTPNVKAVLLARTAKQEAELRMQWPGLFDSGKVIVPNGPVDGLDLIWSSDLVISGGGTMNREAAALGVPVYSIFRGKTGAVDKYLSNNGRLVLLQSPAEVWGKLKLVRRNGNSRTAIQNRNALDTIVEQITSIAEPKG